MTVSHWRARTSRNKWRRVGFKVLMRRSVSSVLGAAILLFSCGAPRFRPQVGHYPDPELIGRAEAIVVGTVTSLKVTDEIRLKECLVLIRAGVVVENVLKGHLSNAWVDYYYFGPWCATTGPVESLQLGSRNVSSCEKKTDIGGRSETTGSTESQCAAADTRIFCFTTKRCQTQSPTCC
jgi:hypothetical protein